MPTSRSAAVRRGSIPIPVFDQNTGNIIAQEMLAKTDPERATNKLVLISIVGRAYDARPGPQPR